MSFEIFTGRGNKAGTTAKITISKTGLISVNSACRQQFFTDTEAVQLLFDAKAKKIGIRPVAKGSDHAYTFRAGKGGAQISGNAFLKHFGIDHGRTKSYDAQWDDKEKAVVLKLK